ncbi:hypothetical protein SELMODRAFT_408420 [Selaginella moellendorffii]|uniref:DNA-directed RNA polymerase III subunit RPC9 n=1 Tax=Selaginella moellendorffii TaxID=88036 RepID=D8R887_SELML|nr:hypothetical protein SELMODRAFT_408420 [Selaginella moellendorffii]
MKIIEAHTGILSNLEVLDLLRKRGADQGFAGAVSTVTQSELKVYDYLIHTPAATQSRESLAKLSKEPLAARLLRPERLQVANLRPASAVEVHLISLSVEVLLIVEDIQNRFTDEEVEELVSRVNQLNSTPLEEEIGRRGIKKWTKGEGQTDRANRSSSKTEQCMRQSTIWMRRKQDWRLRWMIQIQSTVAKQAQAQSR